MEPLSNQTNNKKKLYFALVAILIGCILITGAYLGTQLWKSYTEKKSEEANARTQKETGLLMKEQARDAELAALREELTNLKNKEAESESEAAEPAPIPIDPVTSIIKKWSPRVAHIECSWVNSEKTVYQKSSGSATIAKIGSSIKAVTNKHVLVDKNKNFPQECKIELTNTITYNIVLTAANLSVGTSEDWAHIDLVPDDFLKKVAMPNASVCQSVEVGDQLVILGYPRIGSRSGLTVTEGIVSGTDEKYYITSAKIDKGNSGGAAILVDSDCYLGIPTGSVVGQIESLGRILKANLVIGN